MQEVWVIDKNHIQIELSSQQTQLNDDIFFVYVYTDDIIG